MRAAETGRAKTTDEGASSNMTRTSLTLLLAVSMAATVGCTTKNYVKQQTTPLINKTNELDDMTAKNSKDIKDVDARAQAGIAAVNTKTADVEQKAQAPGQPAAAAQQLADAANSRARFKLPPPARKRRVAKTGPAAFPKGRRPSES